MITNKSRAKQTMQFGVHLMIDGYYADSPAMTDKQTLKSLLETLPAEMGMHISVTVPEKLKTVLRFKV